MSHRCIGQFAGRAMTKQGDETGRGRAEMMPFPKDDCSIVIAKERMVFK
jgi:hypothetical protein